MAGKAILIGKISKRFQKKNLWKEGEDIEFKLAENKVPDDMWETYSAFANTEGGIIVLGVDDKGNVRGVPNAPQKLKNIAALLGNTEKISVNLCTHSGMLCDMELDGKTIILLEVPKATREQKPVFTGGNTKNTFVRCNESDLRCSSEDIQQMIRDQVTTRSATSQVLPGATWSCIDSHSWRAYRNRMQSFKPDHPWVELDDLPLLEKLGGYTRDLTGQNEGLTIAGLLMFGTDDAIERHLPHFHVDYFEYDSNTSGTQSWIERITRDGTWNCNLYQFFFRILPKLTDSFKKPFLLNPDLTARGETNQHRALREALANALVHADYMSDTGITIRQYPDRVELVNSGTLLVSRERMLSGGVSICRNLALQKIFQRIGVVEKAGSGVDTIFKGWMEKSLMPPVIQELKRPSQVKWVLPFFGIIPHSEEVRLKERIGTQKYDALSLLQRTLLLIISAKTKAGHKEIRELYPYIHPADLSKLLGTMEQEGYLQSEGKTTGKIYQIATLQTVAADDALYSTLPEVVQEVRKSKRTTREKLKQAIITLGSNKWITIQELMTTLNRKPRSLHIAIEILIETGKLELLHPKELNHPKQAYRSIDD